MPVTITPNATTTMKGADGSTPRIVGGSASADVALASQSNALYVLANQASFGDIVVVELSSPAVTPDQDINHFMRIFARKDATGAPVDVSCELRQTYVSETSLGTLVATIVAQDVSTTITRYQHRLTVAEAALITDYTAVQFRFVLRQARSGSDAPASARIIYAELQVPQPVDNAVTILKTQAEIEGRFESVGAIY